MDEPTRRAWTRPELVVLVRSGPEEAVLQSCKAAAEGHFSGHSIFWKGCDIAVCYADCEPHTSS